MITGKYNITIQQGADYNRSVQWKTAKGLPVNFTGWTAKMHIRPSVDSATIFWEGSTANGKLIVAGSTGTVTIDMSAAETMALSITAGSVYDIFMQDQSGEVFRVLEGKVIWSPAVTRPSTL